MITFVRQWADRDDLGGPGTGWAAASQSGHRNRTGCSWSPGRSKVPLGALEFKSSAQVACGRVAPLPLPPGRLFLLCCWGWVETQRTFLSLFQVNRSADVWSRLLCTLPCLKINMKESRSHALKTNQVSLPSNGICQMTNDPIPCNYVVLELNFHGSNK